MKKSSALFVGMLMTAILLSACGGGASSGTAASVAGMSPQVGGFGFPNFAAAEFPEVAFDTADMVTMFGSNTSICVDGVADPCTLTAEAAAWARMVNQARATGNCEGLVALASSRFNNKEAPDTVKLPSQAETLHTIIRTFATQFIPEVQQDTNQWAKESFSKKLAALSKSFADGKLNYTLGVYTANEGHALLPYAIEYPTPNTPRIFVYDSNWPGKNRYVDIDLKANTWTFSFSGEDPVNDSSKWSGGSTDMDLTTLSTRTGSCPFCSDDVTVSKTTLLIRTNNLDWSVETDSGTISPTSPTDGTSGVVLPVKGMTLSRYPTTASTRSSYDFVVQIPNSEIGDQDTTTTSVSPSVRRAKLTFAGDASVFAVTPGGIAQFSTPGNKNKPVEIGRTSVATYDPNVAMQYASENLVADASGSAVELQRDGNKMNVAVTASNGKVNRQLVSRENPMLQMRAPGTNGGFTVLARDAKGGIMRTDIGPNGSEKKTPQNRGSFELNKPQFDLPPKLSSKGPEGFTGFNDRNLSNPNYKPDAAGQPNQGSQQPGQQPTQQQGQVPNQQQPATQQPATQQQPSSGNQSPSPTQAPSNNQQQPATQQTTQQQPSSGNQSPSPTQAPSNNQQQQSPSPKP